jgi:hypothetical protein
MTDPYHAQQHDLGDAVQLDNAETLAGPLNDDPLDSGWVPPDRPVAVQRTGVTVQEQRAGGSLEERLREEEPDPSAGPAGAADTDRAGAADGTDLADRAGLADGTEWADGAEWADGMDLADGTEWADGEPDPRAGRLVAPDEGAHADEETDAVADDVGVDGGAASAEEAAMHIEPER